MQPTNDQEQGDTHDQEPVDAEIDSRFSEIISETNMHTVGEKALGDSWLSELAPEPEEIEEFEERLRTCLNDPFISFEKRLEEILSKALEDAEQEIWKLHHAVVKDGDLKNRQRENLLQTIHNAWQKKYGEPL